MSYFLRNLNPFSSTDASIQIDSYSNHSARFIDQSSVCNNRRTQQNGLLIASESAVRDFHFVWMMRFKFSTRFQFFHGSQSTIIIKVPFNTRRTAFVEHRLSRLDKLVYPVKW